MKGRKYSGCSKIICESLQKPRAHFRLELKGLVKSSCLKCTEHMEEVFPGVQCFHV